MHDPRINQLADLLLDHSCRIEKGERVLVEAIDLPDASLVCALVQGAAERGDVLLTIPVVANTLSVTAMGDVWGPATCHLAPTHSLIGV